MSSGVVSRRDPRDLAVEEAREHIEIVLGHLRALGIRGARPVGLPGGGVSLGWAHRGLQVDLEIHGDAVAWTIQGDDIAEVLRLLEGA